MHPFSYVAASDVATALSLASSRERTAFIAGGTNLLDLMKEHVLAPALLIDLRGISSMRGIGDRTGAIRIGALETMSAVAEHPAIARDAPVVREALLASASPQLRNMATIGGNLLQRTRCGYFRDTAFACNKRQPGSGCPAIAGVSRMHAILGTSQGCIASHPSDLAVALVAVDASLVIQSAAGERITPLEHFYRMPAESPQTEHHLAHGELIVAVDIPRAPVARMSHYLKVRDRASYEFALVSAAVAIEWNAGIVSDARIVFGGIGTIPWRSHEAEAELRGQTLREDALARAAAAATRAAATTPHNGFKVDLAARTLKRAIETVPRMH